jgi:hypothetical protein
MRFLLRCCTSRVFGARERHRRRFPPLCCRLCLEGCDIGVRFTLVLAWWRLQRHNCVWEYLVREAWNEYRGQFLDNIVD